jgi:hypothetical protein
MQISALSPGSREKIKHYRYDRIIEKHEGPENWSDVLAYLDPEFFDVAGHAVLLPLDREHLPNLTVLRCIESRDGNILTLFLRDVTYGREWYDSGFLAVCEKLSGEEFYLTTVYHEWFVVVNP